MDQDFGARIFEPICDQRRIKIDRLPKEIRDAYLDGLSDAAATVGRLLLRTFGWIVWEAMKKERAETPSFLVTS